MKFIPKLICKIMLVVFITGAIGTGAFAGQSPVSADVFFYNAINNPNLYQPAGENWAWNAAYNIEYFMYGYRAWGDPAWLEAGIKYYDYLVARLQKGPDGYLGWIGPYIYDTTQWCDVHIGDAILFNGMLDFAEIVLKDPELEKVYGEKARQYVELAEVNLIEKWDARGTWYEHGPYGTYFSWNRYLDPGDLSQWHKRDYIRNSNLSLPFNKNTAMGIAALRLYRITGKELYKDKAVKIFNLLKSRMQLHDDYYVWNYWDPVSPWDINVSANTTRHWVGVHPNRDYQSSEVADIVEAYHSGIVFSEEDMKRIVNTNIKVMWNQNRISPDFRNSNALILPGGIGPDNTAGTLWSSLAYFDQTVRDLINFSGTSIRDEIYEGYMKNFVFANPPGFQRTLLADGQEPEVLDFPHTSVRFLHMALVMPSVAGPGEEMIIAAKTLSGGLLQVELYDASGTTSLLTLRSRQMGSSGGVLAFTWDGKDDTGRPLLPGDYRIRWTLSGDGYREHPITLLAESSTRKPGFMYEWRNNQLFTWTAGEAGIIVDTPGWNEQLTARRSINFSLRGLEQPAGVEVWVDDSRLYAGNSLPGPNQLVLDPTILDEGQHTLTITVGDGRKTVSENILFTVRRTLEITGLKEFGSGDNSGIVQMGANTTNLALDTIRITIDDKEIYQGKTLPRQLAVDTWQLNDGLHRLQARATDIYGREVVRTIEFRVKNYNLLEDDIHPPQVWSFWGMSDIIDRSKTAETSAGWEYAASEQQVLSFDEGRRVRRADTKEYLVWETPKLQIVNLKIYAKKADLAGSVQLFASPDRASWQPLAYRSEVVEELADGWLVISIRSEIGRQAQTGEPLNWFKLVFRDYAPAAELQLGRAEMYLSLE